MEGNILPKICVWKTFHISRDNFLPFSLQYVVFYFVVGLVVISILACSGMVLLISALVTIHLWVFSELFYPKNCFSCCQILNWLANTGKHVEMGGVFFMRPTLCPGKKVFQRTLSPSNLRNPSSESQTLYSVQKYMVQVFSSFSIVKHLVSHEYCIYRVQKE